MAAKGQGARSRRWLTAGSEPQRQTPRLLPLRNHSLGPQNYWNRPLSMLVPKLVETREAGTVDPTGALQQVQPRRSNAPQQTFKDTPIDYRLFFDNVIPINQMEKNQSKLLTNQITKSLQTFVSFARVLAQGLPVNFQFSVSRNLQPVTV